MKSRILLIEDNNEIRENTAEILELSNYIVDTAENGKAGIEKALAQRPDLIICDIMMPVLDGYGVLHLVNKNESLAGIPFIFLTAKTERADLRKGMDMGADDYLTKPFSDIELLNAIDSRLKKVSVLKKEFTTASENAARKINLPAASLDSLISDKDEQRYPKKHLIYREGNHPYKLFFIKKGKVKTFIMNEDSKVLTTGLLGEGDFFGYFALLEDKLYNESAETIEESMIIEIPADEFRTIIHNNIEVTTQIIKILSGNIAEKEQQLMNVAYNSLRKRVANALLQLRKKYGEADKEFSIKLPREDLAQLAGVATESLIRTLSDFKNEKLIDIETATVTIRDERRLSLMVN